MKSKPTQMPFAASPIKTRVSSEFIEHIFFNFMCFVSFLSLQAIIYDSNENTTSEIMKV